LLPRLYAIIDTATCIARGIAVEQVAESLAEAGVQLVQLRDKNASPQQVLTNAALLSNALPDCTLIMNDRADLAALASFDGVHLGQEDLTVADARRVIAPAIIGLSTHTQEQVRAADLTSADYVAIGPVFATGTKADAAAVVGLEGVRMARSLTGKQLVAIGGITRENCRSVLDAGADSVAIISGFFAPGETVEKVARDFLELLR